MLLSLRHLQVPRDNMFVSLPLFIRVANGTMDFGVPLPHNCTPCYDNTRRQRFWGFVLTFFSMDAIQHVASKLL